MNWYSWFTSGALVICLAGIGFHCFRLIRSGLPKDFARPAGDPGAGIRYSLTGAMDPRKKESARLHLPTYAAGILYHTGTFLALLLFVLFFVFGVRPEGIWGWPAAALLTCSGASGTAMLVKRITVGKLRALSVPDDYLSNILLSLFHLLSARTLVDGSAEPLYIIWAGILFLYMPAGKLRHFVYFFAARIQAGLFYGRRGVWPAVRR